MRINHFPVLVLQSEFLNSEISGLKITEIFTQEKNILVISLENDKFLEFSIEKNYEYLVLKKNISKANKNFVNLFNEIYGLSVQNISIMNNDRLICFYLSNNYKLIFRLFTNQANCFLLKNNLIVHSYKKEEQLSDKDISIFKNESNRNNFEQEKIEGYFLDKNNQIELELTKPNGSFEEFENINDLILRYISSKKKFEWQSNVLKKSQKILTNKINVLKQKKSNLELQLNLSKNSTDLMDKGNLLLSNLHLIKQGDTEFKFEGEVIKLKPTLSPAENASKYFEKFKNLKKSAGLLSDKIRAVESELKKNILKLEKLSSETIETNKSSLKKMEKDLIKNTNDETSKFRKFVINDGYEVWVGKDSVSNDLLTVKHTHPEDYWFHVRGASGSHTVLKRHNKKENPDKKTILTAAGIAAYYSKARNGKNIPVAYCEKKFVKKKKGFKAGSVIMEREKVIFVNPALPE